METDQQIWRYWAQNMQRWGFASWIPTLFDTLGVFSLPLAQFVYLCQPVAKWAISDEKLMALARLLEEPEATRTFVSYLQEAGG